MTATPAIQVQGLSYRYGARTALDAIDFSLRPGQFLALLGPNGAGKTTVFSLLTRLLMPSSGTICIFGHDMRRQPGAALKRIGVVFQQSTLDLDLSVMQNLRYHGALHGLSRKTIEDRATIELKRLELDARAHDKIRVLNGGHRRRVEVARALLHQPDILLLDEATVGLDYETRVNINTHIRALCQDRKIAVLWTTHLVEELGDEDDTLILDQGRIVAQGRNRQLREQHDTDSIGLLMARLRGTAIAGGAS